MSDVPIRAVSALLTLYMLLILLRWTAPWLEFDIHSPRWRWIARLTDPLLDLVRRVLPPMGPMDFGPLGALFVVWLVRVLSCSALLGMKPG